MMSVWKSLQSSLALFALLFVAGTPAVRGQESLRCISVRAIDRTEVIDNRTIAFFLNDGRIYLNRLEHACPELDRDRIISYRASTGQLCEIDIITVIEDFGGLAGGASCGLSEFEPSDEETLQVLRGEIEPIEIEPIEIDVEEGDLEETARPGPESHRDGSTIR